MRVSGNQRHRAVTHSGLNHEWPVSARCRRLGKSSKGQLEPKPAARARRRSASNCPDAAVQVSAKLPPLIRSERSEGLSSFPRIVGWVDVLDAARPDVLNLENRFAISGPRVVGVTVWIDPHRARLQQATHLLGFLTGICADLRRRLEPAGPAPCLCAALAACARAHRRCRRRRGGRVCRAFLRC